MKPLDMKKVKENKDYDALAIIGMKELQIEAEERGYDARIVIMLITALDNALRVSWSVEDTEAIKAFEKFKEHILPLIHSQLALLSVAKRS